MNELYLSTRIGRLRESESTISSTRISRGTFTKDASASDVIGSMMALKLVVMLPRVENAKFCATMLLDFFCTSAASMSSQILRRRTANGSPVVTMIERLCTLMPCQMIKSSFRLLRFDSIVS